MLDILLSRHARARVWFDNLAGIPPLPEAQSSAVIMHANPRGRVGHTAFAIELVLPVGGRVSYGLLGATFIQKIQSDVELVVQPAPDGPSAQSTLLRSVYPACGLPEDLVPAVHEGLRAVAGRLPAGRLTITHAAYAPIVATPEIFKVLATLVIRGVLASPNEANLRDMARLIEDYLPR